jgi:hypothetical protein
MGSKSIINNNNNNSSSSSKSYAAVNAKETFPSNKIVLVRKD